MLYRLEEKSELWFLPEKIDDARMELLAKDIADQIETELAYPGQIRCKC